MKWKGSVTRHQKKVQKALQRHSLMYHAQNPDHPIDFDAKEKEAVNEGFKAEVCLRCGTVFSASTHFIRCVDEDCPMKDGKGSLLDQIFPDEEDDDR